MILQKIPHSNKNPKALFVKTLSGFKELATRIELVTSALPMRRTTDCAMPAYCMLLFSATNVYYHSIRISVNQNFKYLFTFSASFSWNESRGTVLKNSMRALSFSEPSPLTHSGLIVRKWPWPRQVSSTQSGTGLQPSARRNCLPDLCSCCDGSCSRSVLLHA